MFVNLHTHSNFSHDGLDTVETLVKQAAEYGQPALALTEHGNVASWPELKRQARKYGIKPIYGLEAYVKEEGVKKPYHITLLVADQEGYRSMIELTRIGAANYKKVPLITFEDIYRNSAGIICLSGCLTSKAAKCEDVNLLAAHLKELKDVFGDRAYAETQVHQHESQRLHNARIRGLDVLPCVLTADAHYANSSDKNTYINRKAWGTEADFRGIEMHLYQGDSSEEARRTLEIADRCTFDLEERKAVYYRVPNADKYVEFAYKRIATAPAIYKERLDYELDIINSFDVLDYFTLLAYILKLGRQAGITFGPGRGSAAGSLLSFLLNITTVDPIRHNLLFERFINPGRKGLPDIDIDVQTSKRSELLRLLQKAFGNDAVAQVATYSRNKSASALQEAQRCLDLDRDEVLAYTKLIPSDAGMPWTLQRCFDEIPEFKRINPKMRNLALRLEGTVKGFGCHAAAILLAPEVTTAYPHYYAKSAEVPMLQWDMSDLEAMGLVKFDLLGLKTLDVQSKTEARIGTPIKHTFKDRKTYSLIASGDTMGVFQLESDGCQQLQQDMQVSNFEELAAVIALYRPGPMSSGVHEEYANRKKRKTLLTGVEKDLSDTYGLLIYQEQAMQLAQKYCDYTLGEADSLRKAIGKKIPEEMAKHEAKFAAAGHQELYDSIKGFAAYGFNRSHAVAYAVNSYISAYYKAHYPLEFWAGYIDSQSDRDRMLRPVKASPELFGPPCWESISGCAIIDGKVRLPVAVLKGVGEKAIEELQRCQPASWADMMAKVNKRVVNVRVQEALAKAGFADEVPTSYASILGLVISGDPLIQKRKYYTNKKYGTTAKPAKKTPGYITELERFVSKKSGSTFWKGLLTDEYGSLSFLCNDKIGENLSCFHGTDSILLVIGNPMNNGNTYWIDNLELA